MLERTRGRLIDLGYAAGWGAVKGMPVGLSGRAFRRVADAAAVRNGASTRQLRRNLRRVVGPDYSELRMDRLVGESLRSYSRYWLETFRLPKMDHDAVAAELERNAIGSEHVDAAMARGKGMILALPHMGNWDVSAIWLVKRGYPFTTVAERLKPESLFERFVEYRESLGMEVLALTGGERAPIDVLSERLRAGGAVCLVADRDLSRNGIEVQFFGETTRMPGGPALLALTTGATLHVVMPWFTEDGWAQTLSAPLTLPEDGSLRDRIAAVTQQIADGFAVGIAEHPADWHMLQKLWLSDLTPRPEPDSVSDSTAATM